MPSTELFGPLSLTSESIDRVVKAWNPGVYALGRAGQNNVFYVSFVGRSDYDLNGKLKEYIGKYPQFKYVLLSTSRNAYEKECQLFHDFKPPENKQHPAKPDKTDYKCPVAGCNG